MRKPKITRGGKKFYGGKSDFEIRNDLPYGEWICKGGREVLFNRFYEPLYERRRAGVASDADPQEWVAEVEQERWFYNDGTADKDRRRAGERALKEWGVG